MESDDGPARALPIDHDFDDEFDLDILPTTGSQYLQRVLLEAQSIPDVVVAPLNPNAFKKQTIIVPNGNGCPAAPSGYTPSLSWQRHQVADFSEIRHKLVRYKACMANKGLQPKVLPNRDNTEEWCRLCFGRLIVTGSHNSKTESTSQIKDGQPPLLSIITAMNQATVMRVLEYHIKWFEATGFSEEQGCWFYGLLANLEKPLTPEACSLLRELARICANHRLKLSGPDDPLLVHLNLILCLVARYFDQRDMADND